MDLAAETITASHSLRSLNAAMAVDESDGRCRIAVAVRVRPMNKMELPGAVLGAIGRWQETKKGGRRGFGE